MNTKVLMFVGVSILAISACTPKVDLDAEKGKIKLVVDQFNQFWETEDMELLSRIMAHDADMVNFGSDAAEHFVGWEAMKESVEQMLPLIEDTKITVKDQVIKVHPSAQVAWFSEVWDWDLVVQSQPVHSDGQRLTGVLKKRNGSWVIVQFHNSVPVSG